MRTRNHHSVWRFILPALLSLLLLVLCYRYWNARYTYGKGDELFAKMSAFLDLTGHSSAFPEEVLPVNISYDKDLVPFYDPNRIPMGDIAITHRGKLLAFLDSLATWDNYRYIVCDVMFSKGITTSADDSLYSRIASMRDIVVASSDNDPSVLSGKTAWSSYEIKHIGDDFLKYNYFSPKGEESIALRMHRDLDGSSIDRKSWWYSDKGQLCVNSLIPDMEFIPDQIWREDDSKFIWNLGADFLNSPFDMRPYTEGRIILIADWLESDMHETVKSELPGIVVIYNAYQALRQRDHIVRGWVLLLLALCFYAELFVLLRPLWRDPKAEVAAHKLSSRWMRLLRAVGRALASWVGYTGFLAIVVGIIFLLTGFYVNVLVIGTILSFLDAPIKRMAA